jgi:branched-chain amino acid transport system substrate-binding protein
MTRSVKLVFKTICAAGLALAMTSPSFAQTKDVKAGLIVPLSGPWARQGQLVRSGAETAIEEINEKGGIKALGGAKMSLAVVDAGDSTEKAKNAAQRLVSQEPELVGGAGSWLSSFTIAVTEVTERAQIPWFTLSYSDQITDRGFRYVFQLSPTASRQSELTVPTVLDFAEKITGKRPKTVGMISDNTAGAVSFAKAIRESGAEKNSLKLLMDEVFTPPLADATALIQRVRSTRPDFLLVIPSNVSDNKLLFEKMNEFRLGKGAVPVVGNSGSLGAPELLKTVGKDLLEGLIVSVGTWSMKGQEEIIDRYKKRTGEPWMTQDSLMGYAEMWIIKEAVERAGVADRVKVAEEVRKMNLTEGPAALSLPGGIKFDEKGRRADAPLVLIQWQDGEPKTIAPAERATAKANWPAK